MEREFNHCYICRKDFREDTKVTDVKIEKKIYGVCSKKCTEAFNKYY